ncbi:MAG: hypothetical protein GF334_12255 [Candidatus Altiarchaeales archaeon]|nr:hypothetical protein [Candidatus Altiarchaeales archaeon]
MQITMGMRVLSDAKIVFTAAIILGLTSPEFALSLKSLITPALVVAMSLSLRNLRLRELSVDAPTIAALFLNYGIQTLVILGLSMALIDDRLLVLGFIVLAATPPAVSLIPFTYILSGDLKLTTQAEVASYLLSLLYAPALIFLLAGEGVDLGYLISTIGWLILIPLVVSQILSKIKSSLWRFDKAAVNLLIGLVIYAVLGLNQKIILTETGLFWTVNFVLFVKTFILGLVALYGLGKTDKAITYSLFASYKNSGVAAAIALALFPAKASLPIALNIVFESAYIIFLEILLRGD